MYTIAGIGDILGVQGLQLPNPEQAISQLLVDSRQLQNPAETLFFALKGIRQNGHHFINELYQSGVKAFIVSETKYPHFPDANVILVPDVLAALQMLTRYHRGLFNHTVVAITGSNGKTVIKEWLYQLLNTDFHVVKSPKSYNSQVGVPLSVWQLHDQADLAIFEAGISRPGEMKKLEEIIRPDIGIMTNLGSAHSEGFENADVKLQEKLQLFERCKMVICSQDQRDVYAALKKKKIPLFSWSFQSRDADIVLSVKNQSSSKAEIQYRQGSHAGVISIPFGDRASIENAAHCLSLIKYLKPSDTSLDLAFQNLLPVGMRMEALEGINGCIVINDVYNADLESLAVALAFSNFQSNRSAKTIILSDLLQQANDPDLYQKVATLLKQHEFKRLLAVGSHIQKIAPHLGDHVKAHFYPDTQSLIDDLGTHQFLQELILIKGARVFGLERVSDLLSLKRHQTVLEVNLAALARNLKVLEGFLHHRGVKIMAMVKAAAYGSGGVEIARFLSSRHIDYLAVAYVDEGVELRKAGINMPILVLNADINHLNLILDYQLEPEIFSLQQLQEVIRYTTQFKKNLDIHLKVETGMNRLGIEQGDLRQLGNLLAKANFVVVKSIFSHLAASEDEAEKDFTEQQIEVFSKMAAEITSFLPYKPIWHLANSNAIVRYPEAQFDMVRIGIGMYGIGMPEHLRLEPVHTLRTFISQIKFPEPGASIGYGRREKVTRALKIATIAIGYADGLIRKAGNRRYAVVVNGRQAPIVGSICMDMTMIDVTDIEDIQIGTEVIIFGKDPTIDALARAADTIPYEVFTSLSSRVKRIYTYE